MSAFVVDPKTINRVLTYLHNAHYRNEWIASYARDKLRAIEWDIDTHDDLEALGQAMYNMNINAVSQRYPNDVTIDTLPGSVTEDGKLPPFTFKLKACPAIQAYKSLQSWEYQCSEGNVVEHSLYKAFCEIENGIANAIVSALPEYEKAEWS